MNFENAVEILLDIEGPLADRGKDVDPGLLTNWGISLRAFPELGEKGIRELTREGAKGLYFENYWRTRRIEMLPEYLRLAVFDFGVHSHPTKAIRELQTCLTNIGATLLVDGYIGKQTVAAAASVDPKPFFRRYMRRRLKFMRGLPNYEPNRNGWEDRLFNITIETWQNVEKT